MVYLYVPHLRYAYMLFGGLLTIALRRVSLLHGPIAFGSAVGAMVAGDDDIDRATPLSGHRSAVRCSRPVCVAMLLFLCRYRSSYDGIRNPGSRNTTGSRHCCVDVKAAFCPWYGKQSLVVSVSRNGISGISELDSASGPIYGSCDAGRQRRGIHLGTLDPLDEQNRLFREPKYFDFPRTHFAFPEKGQADPYPVVRLFNRRRTLHDRDDAGMRVFARWSNGTFRFSRRIFRPCIGTCRQGTPCGRASIGGSTGDHSTAFSTAAETVLGSVKVKPHLLRLHFDV